MSAVTWCVTERIREPPAGPRQSHPRRSRRAAQDGSRLRRREPVPRHEREQLPVVGRQAVQGPAYVVPLGDVDGRIGGEVIGEHIPQPLAEPTSTPYRAV